VQFASRLLRIRALPTYRLHIHVLIDRVSHKGHSGLLPPSLIPIRQDQLCNFGVESSFILDPLADGWPRPKPANPVAYQMSSDGGSLEVKFKLGVIGIGAWLSAILFQSNVEEINPLVVWI
jgi:hypothetical protein